MGIQEAIEQLEEIHGHVSRSEVYRGYRSALLAALGLITFLAAFLQPYFVEPTSPLSFVYFWLGVAIVNFLIPLSHILFHYTVYEKGMERKKTVRTIIQFAPALLAGAFLTIAFCRLSEETVVLLPGLWAILFSMGIYSSKPFLPNAIHWMGAMFFMGGVILLGLVPAGQSLSPWGMGLVFGLGLLAGAFILYFNIERKNHEAEG